MRSGIIDTVTIYEINGVKYTGTQKIDIKSHPRFLGFVKLCVDDREYSIGSNDLLRALDRAAGQVPVADDTTFVGGSTAFTNRIPEERATED